MNSGSEANELALRIARAATGAKDALVIDGAYHGHAGNCVEMSPYKFDGPGGGGRPDWVHIAPVPDRYRGLIRGDGDDVGVAYALELATTIGEACASGRSIAAFFAEPPMRLPAAGRDGAGRSEAARRTLGFRAVRRYAEIRPICSGAARDATRG